MIHVSDSGFCLNRNIYFNRGFIAVRLKFTSSECIQMMLKRKGDLNPCSASTQRTTAMLPQFCTLDTILNRFILISTTLSPLLINLYIKNCIILFNESANCFFYSPVTIEYELKYKKQFGHWIEYNKVVFSNISWKYHTFK